MHDNFYKDYIYFVVVIALTCMIMYGVAEIFDALGLRMLYGYGDEAVTVLFFYCCIFVAFLWSITILYNVSYCFRKDKEDKKTKYHTNKVLLVSSLYLFVYGLVSKGIDALTDYAFYNLDTNLLIVAFIFLSYLVVGLIFLYVWSRHLKLKVLSSF